MFLKLHIISSLVKETSHFSSPASSSYFMIPGQKQYPYQSIPFKLQAKKQIITNLNLHLSYFSYCFYSKKKKRMLKRIVSPTISQNSRDFQEKNPISNPISQRFPKIPALTKIRIPMASQKDRKLPVGLSTMPRSMASVGQQKSWENPIRRWS